MKHSGRGLVWYLPVVWWLWKMIECMYKILGKEENFCWVQSPELRDSRACVELGIFIFFCLLIITKKVYTLKFDVHNMNLFLVVAHLSHKEVSSHPGYFQYLLSLLWFLAIILSEKKISKILRAPQLQLSEHTDVQRSFFFVYGAWIPHFSD